MEEDDQVHHVQKDDGDDEEGAELDIRRLYRSRWMLSEEAVEDELSFANDDEDEEGV